MYPLDTVKPWPENQWYVAAFDHEVESGILGRRILGREVVIFRDQAGVAHALSGVCPHRLMPLSLGTVKGDTIACAYHGLTFDSDGTCVAAPTAQTIPTCSLTRFPLVEAGPILWIWMGDAALAGTTPRPPQEAAGIGAPGWRFNFGQYVLLKARYVPLIDNLFDLSHLGFVHASIVGDHLQDGSLSDHIAFERPEVIERDGRLSIVRAQHGIPVDHYRRSLDPRLGDQMNVGLETEMIGISLIRAGDEFWDGPEQGTGNHGCTNFMHAITPETEHSTHYWSFVTHNYRIDDDAFGQRMAAQSNAVVSQDIDVLNAMEPLFDDPTSPPEISLDSDLGGLRARAQIRQMIRAEEKATQTRNRRP